MYDFGESSFPSDNREKVAIAAFDDMGFDGDAAKNEGRLWRQ